MLPVVLGEAASLWCSSGNVQWCTFFLLTKCFLAIVSFLMLPQLAIRAISNYLFSQYYSPGRSTWRSIRRWVMFVGEHFLLFHFLLSPPMMSVCYQSGRYKAACVTRWQRFCENSEIFHWFVVIKWSASSSHERDSLCFCGRHSFMSALITLASQQWKMDWCLG